MTAARISMMGVEVLYRQARPPRKPEKHDPKAGDSPLAEAPQRQPPA